MLEKPLKLAALAAGSLFTVMSGFPALWQWWKEGKTPSNAQILTTALWASVPATLAGVFKGKVKEIEKTVQTMMEIQGNTLVHDGALKIEEGARMKAIAELDDLMGANFRDVKGAVYKDNWVSVRVALEKLMGEKAEKSVLLASLAQKERELTHEERVAFLRFTFEKLRDRKPESLESLQAILQTEKILEYGKGEKT
jgi:hypothetical protein